MKIDDYNEYKNIPKRKRLFCVFLALSTILNGYSSGIGSFSIGMIGFIFFILVGFFVLFFEKNRISIVSFLPFAFFVYLVCNTCLTYYTLSPDQISMRNMVFYTIKLGTWAVAISITSQILIDYSKLIIWLKRIANISTVYLIIQSVFFYVFKITLTNLFTFGFIKPNYDYYFSYGISQADSYRPASFFAEPAFYGYYVMLVLVLVLFNDEGLKEKWRQCVFLTVGLLLSTSSSAIYLCIVVWIVYLVQSARGWIKILAYMIAGIIGAVLLSLYNTVNWVALSSMGSFGRTISYSINKISNATILSRIGGSFDYLEHLDNLHRVFGIGIGNEFSYISSGQDDTSVYMNAATTLLFWGGIIGAFLFSIMLIYLFRNTRSIPARVLIILYAIGGLYSGIYFSIQGIFYLMIIMYISQSKESSVYKAYNGVNIYAKN